MAKILKPTTLYEIRVSAKGQIDRQFVNNLQELYAALKEVQGKRCKVHRVKKSSDGTILGSEELRCRLVKNTLVIKTLPTRPSRPIPKSRPTITSTQKPTSPRPSIRRDPINDLTIPQIVITRGGRRRILQGSGARHSKGIIGGLFRGTRRRNLNLEKARSRTNLNPSTDLMRIKQVAAGMRKKSTTARGLSQRRGTNAGASTGGRQSRQLSKNTDLTVRRTSQNLRTSRSRRRS